MTKVARLFEEEKVEAVNQAVKEVKISIVKKMLAAGKDLVEIMEYSGLTKKEIQSIKTEIKPSATN